MTVLQKIVVPDIGGTAGVDVIELLVKPGDTIDKDTPLITLESDKATMEIPSPSAGVVSSLSMKIGDKVSEGDLILMYTPSSAGDVISDVSKPKEDASPVESPAEEMKPKSEKAESIATPLVASVATPTHESADESIVSAGPAARRLSHSLGVNLVDVQGSGRKSRVSKEDVEQYVKQRLSSTPSHGIHVPHARTIDFSRFGETETKALNKIKRLTGIGLHNAWVTIPHVTQFDKADITELEAFRKSEIAQAKDPSYKLTVLAFVCKVVCKALEVFPQFNSSLDATGENLIYKRYFNIGIAVETPNGLVVPVIKDVKQLSVSGIAIEMGRLSSKARDKGLMPGDMAGGCFTISSLGGIGGHAFTPIVNSPEVAILGLSKATIEPVYQDGAFVPRLLLPLSLSYDHRVIDGAEAARFTRYISEGLSDLRRILL
ncbi:MAG: 2-oxo acid dehydrogenase subunit E2 [Legionellaceae bacterium]|nr:2-oxo acid dehydrogenase subunit E2 [Legionellaceae bacterium]